MTAPSKPRVLVLARNHPNPVLPTLGLWTERLVRASMESVEPIVVAPVPWAPPAAPEAFRRFRRVPRTRHDAEYEVHHPRFLTGPGQMVADIEAWLWYPVVRRLVDRLHRARPFDVLHAHFIYPEGVIASRLGQRYGIPVVTTEQAPWDPWFTRYPRVARQVAHWLPGIQRVTAVSESLRRNIVSAAPVPPERVEVLYNVVDEETFTPAPDGADRERNCILFVGVIRQVKGLDVLVRAVARLVETRPTVVLDVVGSGFYRNYLRDEHEVRQLVEDLNLQAHVRFLGQASPPEVARRMRSAALLAVPSRSETFSAVSAEALACGTPVVATRCGGPEEIVTPETGRLVPPDDPGALAHAISDVLDQRESFRSDELHAYAVSRFGRAVAADSLRSLYASVLGAGGHP